MKKELLINNIKRYISEIKKGPTYVFQVNAYKNVINKINLIKSQTITDDIIDKMDITSYMNKMLKGFIRETSENESLLQKLIDINGLGPKLARELIQIGLKNINDIKKKKYFDLLPIAAKVDIIYKPISPIPRNLIEHLDKLWSVRFKSMGINAEFVGSYRRKKPQSSDIDILLDPLDLSINKPEESFIDELGSKSIIVYKPYAIGPAKISTIVRLVKYKVNVKVDFFITNKKEYPFALLYATGSKENNIHMRKVAKSQGLLLNQKGLYKGSKSIPAKTERDIFSLLKLPYLAPSER